MIPNVRVHNTNPADNERSTRDTLVVMMDLINAQKDHPTVQRLIERLQIKGLDSRKQINVIWDWMKAFIRYKEDDIIMQEHGIDGYNRDLIQEPVYMLVDVATRGYAEGDCDDFVTLSCTLLAAANPDMGISFVTIKTYDQGPIWAHVYSYLYLPESGQKVIMDCSHGPRVNWELEDNLVHQRQEWIVRRVQNNMLVDTGASQLGLAGAGMGCPHGEGLRGLGSLGNAVAPSGWTGLLQSIITTGVQTASDIFKWQYGPPPPGTAITTGPGGTSIFTGVQPGSGGTVNTPLGTGMFGGDSIALLGIGIVAIALLSKR